MRDMPNDDYEVKHYVAMDAGTAMLMPLMPWVILVIAVGVVALIGDAVAGINPGASIGMVFTVCPLVFFIGFKSPDIKRVFALQTMYVFLSMAIQSVGSACVVRHQTKSGQDVYTDLGLFELLGFNECHTNALWITILIASFAALSILFVILAKKLDKRLHLVFYILVALALIGIGILFATLKAPASLKQPPRSFVIGKSVIYFVIKSFIFAILNVVLGIILVKKVK